VVESRRQSLHNEAQSRFQKGKNTTFNLIIYFTATGHSPLSQHCPSNGGKHKLRLATRNAPALHQSCYDTLESNCNEMARERISGLYLLYIDVLHNCFDERERFGGIICGVDLVDKQMFLQRRITAPKS
jgi:hypothetical protein